MDALEAVVVDGLTPWSTDLPWDHGDDTASAVHIVLTCVPDGWAKLDGKWVELVCLGKDIGEHQLQEIDAPLYTPK